jgi:glutamate N-acetyltransferase/amino-acid N-acetyltransferase
VANMVCKWDGNVTTPRGFKAAAAHCGLKRKRLDLALLYSELPAACAGAFTTNLVKAAPIRWSQKVVAGGVCRAVVINSGNANACTGPRGENDAARMAEMVAAKCGCAPEQVIVGSTGVIGVPLDMTKVKNGIDEAYDHLSAQGGQLATEAILTTDTIPKHLAVEVRLSGGTVTLGGMAKGSGMIHPNMATMMAYVTTDAQIEAASLQKALSASVNRSYNMISVDGDTSTNDMTIVLANGASGVVVASEEDMRVFQEALDYINIELAKMIARDGEGATKLIEVCVEGARSLEDARKIARSISTSNLVKTAIFGEDANWGRVLCAAGYSGAQFVPDKVDIYLGDVQVAKQGGSLPFDEAKAKLVLQKSDVRILLQLHDGEHNAIAWTCDFTYDYVKINATYRS